MRILLLLSACAALGVAGCCCHGQNSCGNDYGCNNNGAYGDGCQQANCNQKRHHLFHHKNRECADNDCSANGKCRLKGKGCRNKTPGHVCTAECSAGGNCNGMQCGDVQLGDAGCCGMDGNVMQTGCTSSCDGGCGCGNNTTFGGCANGQCGGAPTGGCASGNCGSGAPTPTPVPGNSTTSTQPYDELQALQAAGWTIMPSQGGTSNLMPTPAPPVPSASVSEPVAAPPAMAGQTFVAPVRPAGSR